MKKAILAIFCVFYLATSSGASIYLNYCCGVLSDISLTSNEKNCPGSSLSKKKCCDTNKVELKVKADQERIIKAAQALQKLCIPISKPVSSFESFNTKNIVSNELTTGPPLFVWQVPIFIENRSFRV